MNVTKDFMEIDESSGIRYQAYDRIMGNISWLLIALVSLDIKLLPREDPGILFLAILCIMLFFYNVSVRYGMFSKVHGPLKILIDLLIFLIFIVAASWFTGKITSPFISLLYLVLMITSLTQGRRVTYLMVVLAVLSYIFLGSEGFLAFITAGSNQLSTILGYLLELFPFMLIAHLGAMLSGETENARREVERLSSTDEITGQHNMRHFFFLADVQLKIARRYQKQFAICMLDADNLKETNDRYGHFAGTEMIRHIGAIISASIRETDIAARYGGDEFIIMFTECSREDALLVVQRVLHHIEGEPLTYEGNLLYTTLSAGIAVFPDDGDSVRNLINKADKSLYESKHAGKNRVTVYQENLEAHPAGERVRE
jgi:diguanylate cyclase (GGDEF)-like protein